MVRASLSAHNRLLRGQQQRRKREKTHGAADQDEWTRHIAAQAMLEALPSPPIPREVAKLETKSHTPKTETVRRRYEPQTAAAINAHIDAALRAADRDGRTYGLPRPNNAAQQRSSA